MIAEAGTRPNIEGTLSVAESGGVAESLSERLLSIAAMGGSAGGAIGGTVLGAAAGTAFPVACGLLGTVLGCAIAVGGWWILGRLRPALFNAHESARGAVSAYPNVQCRIR